ncbi:basic-leucine zipper transcription factor [Apiospora sp. TS-2023a]
MDVDSKTRKRIQNRVAQRTYRNRVKQRIHELEEQVERLQCTQTQSPAWWDLDPAFKSNMDISVSGTGDCQTTGNGNRNDHSAVSGDKNHPVGYLETSARLLPRHAWQCIPDIPEYTHGSASELPGDILSFSNLNALQFDSFAWDEDVQLVSPPESDPPTVTPASQNLPGLRRHSGCELLLPAPSLSESSPTTTTTTKPDADGTTDRYPATSAPLEERFAYVLRCARRSGFASFDALALQYYARDFAPASDLALEQRLSRRRQLPGLLAELRARAGTKSSSSSWSDWQRRGYQEEMLRAAEEICAGECLELRQRLGMGCSNNSNGVEESEEDGLSEVLQPNELRLEETLYGSLRWKSLTKSLVLLVGGGIQKQEFELEECIGSGIHVYATSLWC